jgi:hypothetical protein
MSPQFIPGLELAASFSAEVVEPILERHFPGLVFSTALTGFGSDVLGFDTPISMDHCWGPRLQVFVGETDLESMKSNLDEVLRRELPQMHRGLSVNFSKQDGSGIFRMQAQEVGPVSHAIEFFSVPTFLKRYLGITHAKPELLEWLRFPEQALLEVSGGQVFRDRLPELREMRETFKFFPRDIFLYRLATEWNQLATDEAFLGRCGEVADELGFRLIAAHLVRHLMRISFLLKGVYAPYSKWFGSGFNRLDFADDVVEVNLLKALKAPAWQKAETHLVPVYQKLLQIHEERELLEAGKFKVADYYDRPYQVVYGAEIASAIRAQILDERLKSLRLLGAFDQVFYRIDATEPRVLQERYMEFIK